MGKMASINIDSKWSDIKPLGYYVYIHRKMTDGLPFYVGKGTDARAWACNRKYNKYWMRVAKKYGVIVEIERDGLTESEAFDLEVQIIKKMIESGEKLCNSSDGGAGGYNGDGRKVYCSNGMEFRSISEAARWVKNSGLANDVRKTIYNCCIGVASHCCGMKWSFKDDASLYVIDFKRPYYNRSREIYCSNGMIFNGPGEAQKWLRENINKLASSGNINKCLNGEIKSCYGFEWSLCRNMDWEVGDGEETSCGSNN